MLDLLSLSYGAWLRCLPSGETYCLCCFGGVHHTRTEQRHVGEGRVGDEQIAATSGEGV